MKRTKADCDPVFSEYSKWDEPMVVRRETFRTLINEKNGCDLFALWMFIYSTAKYQGTNQPRATTKFIANGLGMGINKVKRLKTQLVELGFLERVSTRDDDNKITGHYIRIHLTQKEPKATRTDSHRVENRSGGKKYKDIKSIKEKSLKNPGVKRKKPTLLPSGSNQIVKTKTPPKQNDFYTWLEHYPETHRGMSVDGARSMWSKKRAKFPPLKTMVETLKLQRESKSWVDGYIPTPFNYIHRGMYNDPIPLEDIGPTTSTNGTLANIVKLFLDAGCGKSQILANDTDALFRHYKSWGIEQTMGHVWGTFFSFAADYAAWIESQTWIKNPQTLSIGPASKIFQMYFDEMKPGIIETGVEQLKAVAG